MGIFSSIGKALVYPVRRPMQDISKSAAGIKESVAQAKELQKKRVADTKAAAAYLKGKSPQEKFEEIFELNGWTEEQLVQQRKAARNTRLGMVGLVVVGMIVLLVVMSGIPFWALAIIGPVSVIALAGCAAMAARFAWWEAQIEQRSIFPLAEFMSRKDFFRRVFLP